MEETIVIHVNLPNLIMAVYTFGYVIALFLLIKAAKWILPI